MLNQKARSCINHVGLSNFQAPQLQFQPSMSTIPTLHLADKYYSLRTWIELLFYPNNNNNNKKKIVILWSIFYFTNLTVHLMLHTWTDLGGQYRPWLPLNYKKKKKKKKLDKKKKSSILAPTNNFFDL
jgi:hypothetical protein